MAVKILESIKKRRKLRKITNQEYIGYQGALPLPSGEGPLIASGETADVIVSGDEDEENISWVQVIIHYNEKADTDEEEYYHDEFTSEESAISLGNKVAKYIDSDIKVLKMVLKRLKFKSV